MWCKKKGSGEKNCINREMKSQKKGIKIDEFFSNCICTYMFFHTPNNTFKLATPLDYIFQDPKLCSSNLQLLQCPNLQLVM